MLISVLKRQKTICLAPFQTELSVTSNPLVD